MVPTHHIPLSDPELIHLGKLGVVWAQMDYFLLEALSRLSGASLRDLETFFDKAPTGPRLSAFRKLSSLLSHEKARTAANDFISRSESVLGRRNHLTHGLWGLFSPKGGRPYKAACYFPGNKKGLIYASELPAITNDAVALTNSLIRFLSLDQSPELQALTDRKVHMGYGPPEGQYAAPAGSVYLDLAKLGHTPPRS